MRDALEERLASRLGVLGETVADELPPPVDLELQVLHRRRRAKTTRRWAGLSVAAAIVVVAATGVAVMHGTSGHGAIQVESSSTTAAAPVAAARLAAAGHGHAVGAGPLRDLPRCRRSPERDDGFGQGRRDLVRTGDRRSPANLVPVDEEEERLWRRRARRHRPGQLVDDRDPRRDVRREPRRFAPRALRRRGSRTRWLRAGIGDGAGSDRRR